MAKAIKRKQIETLENMEKLIYDTIVLSYHNRK